MENETPQVRLSLVPLLKFRNISGKGFFELQREAAQEGIKRMVQ
jgi:hypothetical protein